LEKSEEAQDNGKMTMPVLTTGEDGGGEDEGAVENARTNKDVICKAMEDVKEMNSTAHESVT